MTYPITHEGRMFTPDGEITLAEPAPQMLNCGHRPAPATRVSPGYALVMDYTICYPCMTDWEKSFFAEANVFTGYLDERAHAFTTWTGGHLATVTSVTTSRRIYPRGGFPYRLRYVRAVTPDGSRWHGVTGDDDDLITLRRSK